MSRFWNKIKAVTLRFPRLAGSPWFKIAAWVTFVLTVTVWVSYDHWCWLSDGESGSTTVRNLGLMVAALIGLPIAIWRSVVAERQSETAQRRLMNERYQKGAEMLGSEVPSVRLGGIYDLTRLAREQPGDYHMQILSLLCAFVRNPPAYETDGSKLRADVQEVMTAIGSRTEEQIATEKGELSPLNFSGADLQSMDLERASINTMMVTGKRANLERAILTATNLRNAKLDYANLTGAQLFGSDLTDASMFETNLTSAVLSFCKGLTQEQIDEAQADPDKPPNLDEVFLANTRRRLIWKGTPVT